MDYNEYKELAARTDLNEAQYARSGKRLASISRLMHGVIGLITESAELLDNIKRYAFYKNEINRVNLIEECGDVFWYFSLVLDETHRIAGTDLSTIFEANIQKLRARYPETFDERFAINRDVTVEHTVMNSVLSMAGHSNDAFSVVSVEVSIAERTHKNSEEAFAAIKDAFKEDPLVQFRKDENYHSFIIKKSFARNSSYEDIHYWRMSAQARAVAACLTAF